MKKIGKKILLISLILALIYGVYTFVQNKPLNVVNASTTETYWEFKDEPSFTDGSYNFNFTLMYEGNCEKTCNTLRYSNYYGLQFITTGNVLITLYENGWTDVYKYPFTITSTLDTETENWLKGFATEKYVVKYNLNGGTGTTPTDTSKYFIENSVTLNNGSGISKSAYTFSGWSTNKVASTGTTSSYTISESDVVDHCITFYAIWTPIDYTITYNLDGGTNDSNNPSTYNIKSDTITLANPTKTGYKFLGWYDNSSYTGSAISTISNGSSGNKILYAKWEEKTTININDNIQRFIYDGNNKIPALKDTSNNLITISGFNYTYEVYTTDYETCYESKRPSLYRTHITRAEDETYKAVDAYIEYVVTYSVTYKANTGVGDDIIDDADDNFNHIDYFGQYVDIFPDTYSCDKKASIKANTFTKENYTFSFWNTKQDGTGTPYYPNNLVVVTENLVLYACYNVDISAQPTKNNNYTVGVGATDAVTYIWEKETTVTTPVDLSNITVSPGTVNTSNNTITATLQGGKYTINIVCTDFTKSLMFYTDGELTDGVIGDDNTYYYASKGFKTRLYTITSDSEFTISNINYFGSGYTEINNETSNSILSANEKTNYRCKLKSIFNGITYSDVITPNTISFEDSTGAEGDKPNSINQLEGRKITIPTNTFTKTGFRFTGWTLSSVYQENDEYIVSSNDVTFMATWKRMENVSIDVDTQTYTYSGSGFSFVIDGNVGTGFVIYYAIHKDGEHIDSDWTINEPIDANSYDVKIARNEDDTYFEYSKTIPNGLLIKIKVSEPVISGTYTYTGQKQTLVLSGVESYMITSDSLEETNAGTYTITYTINDTKYEWDDNNDGVITWIITKAQAVISNTSDIVVKQGGTITPTATSNFGTVSNNISSINTNVPGVYTLTYRVESTSNFDGATKTVSVTVKSEKIEKTHENKTQVEASTNNGFDPSIELEVTITAEIEVEEDLLNLLNNITSITVTPLSSNEKVGTIYDIKLIQVNGDNRTEIQPEDGEEVTVKILIPSDVNIDKVTRIIHIHSDSDIEEIAFDKADVDDDGYYTITVSKFSKFAFIYQEESLSLVAILLIALSLLIVVFISLFFIWRTEYIKALNDEDNLEDRKFKSLDKVYCPINTLLFGNNKIENE